MKRRSFTLQLLDQKEYAFSERNAEDMDISYLQDKIRADRVIFIQNYIRSEELQMPLLMQEMRALYGHEELWDYFRSHKAEYIYHSFKIENTAVSFDSFMGLVNEALIQKLWKLILELENHEDINEKDIAASLGVPEKKVISWRDEQPQVYTALKRSIKKNNPPKEPPGKLPKQ